MSGGAIPNVSGTTPARKLQTDLPVLMPAAGILRNPDHAGSFRLQLKLWHGAVLLVALAMVLGVAEAAEGGKDSPWVVLVRWMPFLLLGQEGHWQGFSLNIIISFFAHIETHVFEQHNLASSHHRHLLEVVAYQ